MEDVEQFLKVSGSGDGSGYGYGDGSGSGDGSGDGSGEYFDGHKVHTIDGVNTVITSVRGNLAKGFTIKGDLTIEPCFVAKVNDCFAHGETAREAYEDALSKYTSNLPEEERISMFLQCHNFTDTYPAKDLFEWHNKLTGSCRFGRLSFCEQHGIDISKDRFTVDQFIELTKNEFGGDVIRQLKTHKQ